MRKLDLEKLIEKIKEHSCIVCFETEADCKEFEKGVFTEKKREVREEYFVYDKENKESFWLDDIRFTKKNKIGYAIIETSDFLLKTLMIEENDRWSNERLTKHLIEPKNFKLTQFEKRDRRETEEVLKVAIKTELLVKHLTGSEKEGYKEQLVALDYIDVVDTGKRTINKTLNNVISITDLAGNLQSQFGIEPKKYEIEKIDERQAWKTKAMELASLNLDLELKLKEKTPVVAAELAKLEEELKGLSKEVKHTVKWD